MIAARVVASTLSAAALSLCLAPATSLAQGVVYQVIETAEPYTRLIDGTRLQPGLADGDVVALDLPFDFSFYGRTYRRLWINANGFVGVQSLTRGSHSPPASNPAIRAPNGFIAPLWADWCSSFDPACAQPRPLADIGVYYAIDTRPGLEKITIEWRSVRHFQDVTQPTSANFKVTLFGGPSAEIEFAYGDLLPGVGGAGQPVEVGGRMGIEDISGAVGTWVGPCTGNRPCATTEVQSLSQRKLRFVVDVGVDLSLNGISTPPRAYPGLPMRITARLVNRHRRDLGPSRVRALLLPATQTATAGALVLGETGPLVAPAFSSIPVTLAPVIPETLRPGYYRVALVADVDNQVVEIDEANNLALASADVRISGSGPDFSIRGVRLDPAAPLVGRPATIRYVVENLGNQPGAAVVSAYLSTNPAITTADLLLGTAGPVTLAAQGTLTTTISVTIPESVGTGRFFVGLIVDPDNAVAELDETNNIARRTDAVDVVSNQVVILTDDLPPAILTRPYDAQIRAIGGDGTFTYRLIEGVLPRGMIFDARDGSVVGIPVEAGQFTLRFEVASNGVRATKRVGLAVIRPEVPLTIGTRTLPEGVVGSDYAVTPQVVGGVPPLAWRVVGSLPRGLLLATNGTVLGAPSEPGTFGFGLEVRDNASNTASVTLSLSVRLPGNLSVIASDLPDGLVGEPYEARLFAVGGVAPLIWTAGTALPPGLGLSPSQGTVRGVPERAGGYRFRVQALDALGVSDGNLQSLTVHAPGSFFIATAAFPATDPDEPFRAVVRVMGGEAPFTWTVDDSAGRLPPGIEARPGVAGADETPDDFVISGSSADAGIWAITIKVVDSQGRVAEKPFALVVRQPPPPPPPAPEKVGCRCVRTPAESSTALLFVLFGFAALVRRRPED